MEVKGDYCPPAYEVPRDEQGYIQSFSIDQVEQFKQFFTKFGFVVVRDILNKEECQATISEIWDIVEGQGFDRNSPSGWNTDWEITGLSSEGIISIDPIFRRHAINNRQNPNLYQVCSSLLDQKELLVNHDRYGLFRPTRDVVIDGTKTNQPNWETDRNLHLDMNPWRFIEHKTPEVSDSILNALTYRGLSDFIEENNEIGVAVENKVHIQALINLADNKEEDGGFQIVPGFRHHLAEWTTRTPLLKAKFGIRRTFIVIPTVNPVHKLSIRVTARAGSAIIWDQRTAHGSQPNKSNNPRYAQFLRLFRTITDPSRLQARTKAVQRQLDQVGFDPKQVTELGQKVFGLKSWNP